MALAPVGAAVELVHDRLDRAEVGLPRHPFEHVHGDVPAVAPGGGGEQRVVGGHSAHLDREGHGEAIPISAPPRATLHQLQHAAHRLHRALARERVLHLGEAHQPRAGEDPIGAVHAAAGAREARDEPVDAWDLGGHPPSEAAEQPEGVVGEQHVVGVCAHPAARAGRLLGAVVGARQRGAGVGEDVELEVVVCERQLLEALERLLQRGGGVDATQAEGGHAAQRHLRHHAERAQPHARGAQQLGVVLLGAAQRRAVGEHQRERRHLRGDVAQARAGAVRGGRDRAGDALRVDVAEVLERQANRRQAALSAWIVMPPCTRTRPLGAIDLEQPVHAVEPQQAPVGERDVAEGVPRHRRPARAGRARRPAPAPRRPR